MIKIFADSTADLSRELADRYEIGIIPLFIILDDRYYRDGVDITRDEIFQWSDKSGKTPKTATPSIDDVVTYFRPFMEKGDEIFYFAISEEMSSSANVARLAAEELGYAEHVYVVDSMSLSTGIALLTIKAAEMVKEGYPADMIYNRILNLRSAVRASFVVDTLTFLERGGRCSATESLIGNALKLKPMIEVTDGRMDAARKYRGSNERVIKHYVSDLKSDILNADPSRVFITHTVKEGKSVEEVRKFLEDLHYFDEILETDAGCVVGSHCGPGTLGVLYISK